MKRALWRATLPMLAAGCATLGHALRFQEPAITLKEIRVTGLGLTGGTLDLALDVFNPNDYRLRSTRLELGIDLEQVHFGDALVAALDLENVAYLESDVEWIKNLLAFHNIPAEGLRVYLKLYAEVLQETMGDPATDIVHWIEGYISRI